MKKHRSMTKKEKAPRKAAAPNIGAAAFSFSTPFQVFPGSKISLDITRLTGSDKKEIDNLLSKTHYFRLSLAKRPSANVVLTEGDKKALESIPGGSGMNERDEHTECCFDTYCKHLLKYEMIDVVRESERLNQREVNFSSLSPAEQRQLQYTDKYAPGRQVFDVLNEDVEVMDESLVRALTILPVEHRNIVLLAYLFGLSDAEIAIRLGLNRSTVQYRRKSTLEKLRKLIMEENEHE